MATIEINKKENNDILTYTPYNESSDIKTEYTGYSYINQIAYNQYMPYNNATDVIQAVANEVISAEAVYWEEILLPNKPDDIDLSLAKICNEGQFFVIFCPYNTENNHYMYSWNSTDGGYTWYQHSFSNNNLNTQINEIKDVKVAKTALGYRVVLAGSTVNTNIIDNVYTVLFSYLNPTQISYCLMEYDNPFTVFHFNNLNNFLTKTPRGFFMLNYNFRLNRYEIIYSSYIYNKSYAQNGLGSNATGTFMFEFYAYFDDDITMLFYDELLDRLLVYNSSDEIMQITFKPYYFSTQSDFTNIVINHACQSFQRCLFFNSNLSGQIPIKYVTFPTQWDNSGYPLFDSLSQFNSESNTNQWIFGNKYRLYNIDKDGNVYYKRSIDGDWIESNQSSDTTNTNFIPLKSIISSAFIQNAQFISTDDNSDIVGIVEINNTYKVIHTHMGNIR